MKITSKFIISGFVVAALGLTGFAPVHAAQSEPGGLSVPFQSEPGGLSAPFQSEPGPDQSEPGPDQSEPGGLIAPFQSEPRGL